jgi:ferrous iron transport protein B
MSSEKPVTVALAGQPNVGKSAVFNMLTGMNQHVGNWPGKTVEQKKGKFEHNENAYEVVDLPGTYSLTANSPEEAIARDFIIKEEPDVVVVVVNAASLERTMYLVSELLPLPSPLIIALNMMDVAEEEGYQIKPEALESATGLQVVPMVAARKEGITELKEAIDELSHGRVEHSQDPPEIPADLQTVLGEIKTQITGYVPYPEEWASLKLLEGDRAITETLEEKMDADRLKSLQKTLRDCGDAMLGIGASRYDWIGNVVAGAIRQDKRKTEEISRTEKIDRYVTHPFWGMLMMVAIFIGALVTILITAKPVMKGAMRLLPILQTGAWEMLAGAPQWATSLVADGIIVGAVVLLIFIWFILLGLLFFGIMEDVGYMARIAYLMDRLMERIGLCGRSSLCLFTGFVCNVVGVMGARTIDTERARLRTILLMPFIPCPAQMSVTFFLVTVFFPLKTAILVVISLVLLNLIMLVLFGRLFGTRVVRGERQGLIMELPLYHRPNPRTIGMSIWQGCKQFMTKAGTVIFAAFVFIWAVSYFPNGDINTSILAAIGRALSPLGNLMGLNWQMLVALLTSFLSKETTLTTMGILLDTSSKTGLASALQAAMPPSVALGFMVTSMLFVPCMATVGVIAAELRSWRWAAFAVSYLLVVAFGMGIMVYQIARLVI